MIYNYNMNSIIYTEWKINRFLREKRDGKKNAVPRPLSMDFTASYAYDRREKTIRDTKGDVADATSEGIKEQSKDPRGKR